MGLDPAEDSFLASSLAGAFSFSPADAPPDGVASLEPEPAEPPEDDSPAALSPSDEDSLEALSPVELVEVLVEVVDVEVVCTAAFSALVSVGGVISGVLLGTASETLLEPHAPSETPARSATHALSAKRALTAGPCAFGRWGTR